MHQGKVAAARAAFDAIKPGSIIGVGTGSTVNCFIDELASEPHRVRGAVSSSDASTERLKAAGIDVLDLNATGTLEVYIDGADEANPELQLIKGGGGALTREKIVAAASQQFICIVDESKEVEVLGEFPLPVEIIPMARSYVARELVKLGADPEYREGTVTDNGNIIVDCYSLSITDPLALENTINNIVGVVSVGLFAARPADHLLIGHPDGAVAEKRR